MCLLTVFLSAGAASTCALSREMSPVAAFLGAGAVLADNMCFEQGNVSCGSNFLSAGAVCVGWP